MKPINQWSDEPISLPETASQTAGPYVHIGLALDVAGLPERKEEIWNELASDKAPGEHIHVTGRVIDGNGDPLRDALLEAWQADSKGEYHVDFDLQKPFRSFGRTAAANDPGEFVLKTVKPGRVGHSSGTDMAPHILLSIFARGINIQLQTRLYFDDEAAANAECPVLKSIESDARRQTLIARRQPRDVDGKPHYHLDIRLQGEGETVFFDF